MTESFNKVYVDRVEYDGFQIIETKWNKEGICKRCVKPFIKKKRKQIFCSRDCVSKYRIRLNAVKKYSLNEF